MSPEVLENAVPLKGQGHGTRRGRQDVVTPELGMFDNPTSRACPVHGYP
jgi:hypothetical protein